MNLTLRIQRLIALCSVLLFAGKMWAWYLTHSVAIFTDALESTVNVITGFIGWYSLSLASRPSDENHPYGHGKAEYVSAALEGALVLIAGIMIIYEAVDAFLFPHPLSRLDSGMILTAITGVINFLLGVYALRVARQHRSMTVEAAATHLKSDAYSTFAMVAGLLIVRLSGWAWLDQVIAMVFGVIIIVTGYKVLRKSLGGIMDEADEALLDEVIAVLNEHRRPAWIDLHNLRSIQYGSVLHIDAHLTLPWYYSVQQAGEEIHHMEEVVRAHFGGKVECFVHIDACKPFSCAICTMPDCAVRQHSLVHRIEWNRAVAMENRQHRLNE
ncbi:cation diffusion facilitator family transporter [Rurimicrobium arvi]